MSKTAPSAKKAPTRKSRGAGAAAATREAAKAGPPVDDVSRVALNDLSVSALRPQSKISRYFSLHELTRSEIASRQGIPNSLSDESHLRGAVNVAREVLDPVRKKHGAFTPNSVYRSQELERALKHKPSSWISTSQHTRGEACDIEIVGVSTLALAQWIADNLEFDQLICECYDSRVGANSGWVHVSLRRPEHGPNRREKLSYIADGGGRWIYVKGLRGEAS